MSYIVHTLSCPFCDFTSKQEPRFIAHMVDLHAITSNQLQDLYDIHVLKEPCPVCECGCRTPLPWSGWKRGYISKTLGSGYIRGHNARDYTSWGDTKVITRMVEKRIDGYKTGRLTVHNKGETKETSPSIARQAVKVSKTLREGYASGRLIDWRVGNEEKAFEVARKSSVTKRLRYAAGMTKVWNKGDDAKKNPLIARIAAKISHTMKTSPTSSRRFTPAELVSIVTLHGRGLQLLTDPNDYRNKYQRLSFKCPVCSSTMQKSLMMLVATPLCFTCHPKESIGQLEVFAFVQTLVPDAKSNDRTILRPKELDIFIPSKNFAIEYNGLYHHSEECKPDINFHSQKSSSCRDLGISLFHVFSDEWRDKRPIIESMIHSRLGFTPHKLMARKLVMKKLTTKTRRAFFDANHLDGDVRAKVAWGLFDGDELVSAMSLRTPFHAANGTIELARFASVLNTSVIGALGKLLKTVLQWAKENGFKKVMTYVDTRCGDGHGYEKTGFQFVKETTNRFWWTDFNQRFDRFKFKADKSRGMTEAQVAEEAGVVRIFGCQNRVYVMNV